MHVRSEPHAVVLGPAAPAEDERIQRLVRLAGLGRLLCDLQVASRPGFERRPDGISPGQELVQSECEDGEAAGLPWVQLRALEQPFAEHLGATLGIGVRERRKLRRGALSTLDGLALQTLTRLALQPPRNSCIRESLATGLSSPDRLALQPPGHLSEELAGAGFFPNPEGRFDPRCEWMAAERLVVGGWPVVRGDGGANGVSNRRVRGIDLGGRALQRFADDLLRCEVHPEQGLDTRATSTR